MEEEIIQPIDRELLKSELTPDKQLRMTNKSHNEIYIVTANDSPNVLKEIGRLREIAFREAGGGTGKSMDLDEFDFGDNCYKQLIVWNPEANEIIGGYRYLLGRDWQLYNIRPHQRLAPRKNHNFEIGSGYLLQKRLGLCCRQLLLSLTACISITMVTVHIAGIGSIPGNYHLSAPPAIPISSSVK